MIPLSQAAGTLPGYLLLLLILVLVVGQAAVLVLTVRDRRGRGWTLAACALLLAGLVLAVAVVDLAWPGRQWYAWDGFVRNLPWLWYALLELVLGVLTALAMANALVYRRRNLTPDAIRRVLNLLPAGVCVSRPDGTVLLTNLNMVRLCRALTGSPLTDANRFWARVRALGEDRDGQLLVHLPNDEAWLFSCSPLQGGPEQQILAADVTDRDRITRELAAKNRQLKQVQQRLKAVAADERGLVAARELVNARTTVHNQLGNVLLIGKYYMDHPERMDETELLHLLEYQNYFLLGEAEQTPAPPDDLDRALDNARRIGLEVETLGPVPTAQPALGLLAQAVAQCGANAVRHAGADRLTVTLRTGPEGWRLELTNNGTPPAGPVAETGGLAALRRAVESAGGVMTIQSAPVFALRITLP